MSKWYLHICNMNIMFEPRASLDHQGHKEDQDNLVHR